MTKTGLVPKAALVVSSVVFAAVHCPTYAIPQLFLAFARGWIRIKTGYPVVGIERKDGGNGVGFTGGHYHRNWAIDDFRGIVRNAVV